jgi:hypothetical protein
MSRPNEILDDDEEETEEKGEEEEDRALLVFPRVQQRDRPLSRQLSSQQLISGAKNPLHPSRNPHPRSCRSSPPPSIVLVPRTQIILVSSR